MPDVAVHAAFGKEVLSSLPEPVRGEIEEPVYTFGLFGPDLWFMHRPWQRREGRGRQMHTTRTGAFLISLARKARSGPCRKELFSWLAGFLCHYALDSVTHPYVIYVTTEVYHFPRCHMALEHALDRLQVDRDGYAQEKHPVTDHYFPSLRLPRNTRGAVNEVFEETYGWKNAWQALNRSAAGYRRVWRIMENPCGFSARLARRTRSPLLCSLLLSETPFNQLDAENLSHASWRHPHDETVSCQDSFPQLRTQAKNKAAAFIDAAWHYVYAGDLSEEAFAAVVGNNSYLSGLPADDPRNHLVPSLLPSGGGKGGRKP